MRRCIAGGLIWGRGDDREFCASYVPMIGLATSFSMGESNTMIFALWGVSGRVRVYLVRQEDPAAHRCASTP